MELTKPQKSILNMENFAGGAISNVCGSMLLSCRKPVNEMKKAINEIYRLNDALRIRIIRTGEEFGQIIVPYEEQNITVLSFDNKFALDSYSSEYAKQPFDLYESLCDINIVLLPECSGVLVKFHHIVGDAWTISLIGTQLIDLLNNKTIQPDSYIKYAQSEKEYLSGVRYKKDRDFFISEFSKCNESTYMSASDSHCFKADRASFTIDKNEYSDILSFASENNASVFTLFMTALAAYMSRVNMNTEKVYIGTTVLNRNGVREKNTMGLFVNTIPVLLSTDNNKTFIDTVDKADLQILSALRHQKYNYSDLIEELRTDYHFSEKLYDVILSYQNAKITGDNIETTWYHNGMQAESLQIHIDDRDNDGILKINYDYQTEKFSLHDIEILHEHICKLLFFALNNKNKKLSELEILSDEEKHKLLYDFNDTKTEYDANKSVYELFEEQAKKTPEKTAVTATDKILTYSELQSEASHIASALVKAGVKHGDFVTLDLSRKSFVFSSIFGILKLGAAFVPINNSYPQSQKEYIINNCNSAFEINENNIGSLLSQQDDFDININTTPEDICYCIYTSGSTGAPKGTLISNRNIANLANGSEKNMFTSVITKDCKIMCSFAAIGFDMFIAESLVPLVNGITVVFADEKQCSSQKHFADLLRKWSPDVFQCTPTKLKLLIADKNNRDYLKNLKTIILGGEAFDIELFKELKCITDAKIYNFYGPTETTVWATNALINGSDITIGKPMANTQVYILDKYMNPVPIRVNGELCIAGDCVGKGYLNRLQLTEEKFVPNPFGTGKLYKTGDIAFWNDDGNIGYVGRNDFQVKIRGLRIELGEIETAISSIDGIDFCVVVVRKNSENRQIICAFYTGEEMTAQEIRELIENKIPKYMIPHVFAHINEMPLTSSGKLNRNSLPEIDIDNIRTNTVYVAPETKKEIILISCVQSVLGEKIGMLDNFIETGGDSLKSIELVSKLEAQGFYVSVETILNCKNMKELANALEIAIDEKDSIKYGNIIPPTPAQMRIYTGQLMAPDATLYNIPYIFRTDEIDPDRLTKALNELIARHESLRTHFESRNGQIVQVIDNEAKIDVIELSSDDINSFAKPFDLTVSPLIHVGYYKNTVMIDFHHIITDGESMPVFFRELNELYMGRKLTTKTVQYGEFAVSGINTDESEKYWLSVFEEEPPVLELPTDEPRHEKQSFNGNALYDTIDISLQNKISNSCKNLGITPYVFYMAAFSILLSKYSGNEDIVIGTPISGRQSKFLDTVGMFVNTIAFRSRTDGMKKIGELMHEIKNDSVQAIEYQNYPFGELVKKLDIKPGNRNPLFDVMLAYQSFSMTDITFADKKAELIPVPITTSKCDLTFTIMPRAEDVVIIAEYCSDLFKQNSIQKLIDRYKTILIQCLDASIYIKDVCIIDDVEKNKLLYDFNNTKTEYSIPENSTLYSLFEANAKKMLKKTCITANDKSITFGELLKLSEALDSKINKITNNKKSVVAVIADRSIEMYAAIYGIIRGGNAYLPISPDYPEERIKYILNDSSASLVIAQSEFISLSGDTPSINMTEFIDNPVEYDAILPCSAMPDDTAYIIYTSGSTGQPKGAMISNKSAINRILWMQEKYPLDSNSVILQKTPYTFDVSVWELFWWGIVGGKLAASKPGEHFLPIKILEETEKNKVTHLHFVPSVFDVFLTYLENHTDRRCKFNSVKHIFLSGEALNASLIQRFYNMFDIKKIKLHNLYGPTECTVDVTYYDCKADDSDPVPIGKPINNTSIYITDKYLNIVPIGTKGELCICGVNVGKGYINRSELTNDKFIPNPFGSGKLYKTGDIACRREDGQIIFYGRMDGQIKINGQRIETEEIESVIKSVPEVDAAFVIFRKINNQKILTAFYCGQANSENIILECCKEKLPSYMIPGAIHRLDKLPLNPSGKLDRKFLNTIEINIFKEDTTEPPINKTENKICNLFEKILNVSAINRNSNFFDLGGTSLSMISILSEDLFSGVSAVDFIANPTPSKLAKLIKQDMKQSFSYIETLLHSENSKKSLILFPFAGGGVESFANLVNSITKKTTDISIYFIRYLHSKSECEAAATEISELLDDTDVYFYSHCVGSAVGMQILNCLEKKGYGNIKHFIAGASIPSKSILKKNTWNFVPNIILKRILTTAGANFENLSDEKINVFLNKFRNDTDFATWYFSNNNIVSECSFTVVISKNDIFTRNYKKAEKMWKHFAETVNEIHFLDSGTHYFQSTNSDELADIIISVI